MQLSRKQTWKFAKLDGSALKEIIRLMRWDRGSNADICNILGQADPGQTAKALSLC
jgi:hypothetical protein